MRAFFLLLVLANVGALCVNPHYLKTGYDPLKDLVPISMAVIFANVLGFAATASIQSIVSNAADHRTQGQTMGAVASLNSAMAVLAPVIGAPLLGAVSHLPAGDWRIGAPYYFCAALQLAATVLALRHFRAQRELRLRAATTPSST